MSFRDQWRQGIRAWQPGKYRALTAHPFKMIVGTFFAWFGIAVLLMVVLGVPSLVMLPHSLADKFSAFDTLQLDANVSMQGPVMVAERPLVVVDLEQENLSGERVLVNEEGVHVRKPLWQGVRSVSWTSAANVLSYVDMYESWFTVLAVLLLPSLVLVVGLLFLVQSAVLVGVCVVLGLLITRLARFSLGVKQLVKVCVAALVPLAALELVPFFWFQWVLVPSLLYVVLVFVASWFVGEDRHERHSHN
ncbi:hypothetical protein GF367_02085 [Candidatus Woesearchaeota archaeon]|nr:hypothetical protein [Candidatus Woesearchaeota archaeon]